MIIISGFEITVRVSMLSKNRKLNREEISGRSCENSNEKG